MKEIYNRLLRLALTVGLTEREAFVDKVSEVIARKTSADPRYGERLAKAFWPPSRRSGTNCC